MGGSDEMNSKLNIFTLITLGIIGTALLLFSTINFGIGTTPDSTVYINTARNLLNGEGFYTFSFTTGELEPMKNYPPLFPAILAGISLFGIQLLQSARLLNSFVFGINIVLVGLIIKRYTRNIWLSLFGSIIIMSTSTILFIHSMAWTEPLFLFFTTLGFYLLSEYFDNKKRAFFIASAVAIGLAFLTRYAGAAFVAATAVSIFLFSEKKVSKRIIDSIIFAAIASFPVILWFIRNRYYTGSATTSKTGFHLITSEHIKSALLTLSMWLLPGTEPSITKLILIILAICLFVFGVVFFGNKKKENAQINTQPIARLPLMLVIFIFIYMVFLIISISWFYLNLPLDYRILSPVFISGVILIICAAHNLLSKYKLINIINILLILICVAYIGPNIPQSKMLMSDIYNDGLGYSRKLWKESKLLQEVKKFSADTYIFSNAPDLIYLFTEKKAVFIPLKIDANSGLANDKYSSELSVVEKQLKNNNAYLIYIRYINRWYLPSEAELRQELQLNFIKVYPLGTIYNIS
jgi:4-amino-4-deoxy-L-arabinose transferase-like glycosyltransferase